MIARCLFLNSSPKKLMDFVHSGVQSITACSLRAVIRHPGLPYIGFGAIQEPNFPDYRRAKPNPAESGFETVKDNLTACWCQKIWRWSTEKSLDAHDR